MGLLSGTAGQGPVIPATSEMDRSRGQNYGGRGHGPRQLYHQQTLTNALTLVLMGRGG